MYKNVLKGIFLFALILCLTSGLGMFISAESQEENSISAITQNSVDTDGDGLNDSYEEKLGTNKTNKYGDLDNDGLYDFEELLDTFTQKENGMPNLEEPFYKYDESKTHNETLDIYHALKIEEKDQFFRDITILGNPKEDTNTLYWNVTVIDTEEEDEERIYNNYLSYVDNYFLDVDFAGEFVMTSTRTTTFLRNSFVNVSFSGTNAGGSQNDATYIQNKFVNVNFSGNYTGATLSGDLEYYDNQFSNVSFTGLYAGGSKKNRVYYNNNTIRDTVFQGRYSGGSGGYSADITYENNTLENVTFSGKYAGGASHGSVNYTENSFELVVFSGQNAGGSEIKRVTYLSNNLSHVDFSGRNAGGSQQSSVLYKSNSFGRFLYFSGKYAGESENGETVYTQNYGSLWRRHDYTQSSRYTYTETESWIDRPNGHPPYERSDFGGIGAIVLSFFLISVTGTLFSLALWFVRKDKTF